jgi:YD repeat-containing protein
LNSLRQLLLIIAWLPALLPAEMFASVRFPVRTLVSTYDALNRLATLSEGGRSTSYAYDLYGNVLTKTLPNGETVANPYNGLNRMFTEKGTSPQGVLYNCLSVCDAVGPRKRWNERQLDERFLWLLAIRRHRPLTAQTIAVCGWEWKDRCLGEPM